MIRTTKWFDSLKVGFVLSDIVLEYLNIEESLFLLEIFIHFQILSNIAIS